MSDDEEDEYNTIAQAASRRGVKLLFSKSKVRASGIASGIPQLTRIQGLCPPNLIL
jgi:hypothetical protein